MLSVMGTSSTREKGAQLNKNLLFHPASPMGVSSSRAATARVLGLRNYENMRANSAVNTDLCNRRCVPLAQTGYLER